ncbi:RNA-directed DNA polymerase [Nitrospirillum sp. BR 11828]|uniref:RNA-directed DNA polymerase n=1 Tax=Nitrospirillum sp. BR 11828 TaxID=3104325 RepID=UPI002ACAF5B5|nr:RNA-directed DNA polymerase [Nitrospirillum sp. BR 11828]MDZ5648073.1 RNA-directed DNA polymerase [Nitrospirillum sp. BR 11828]
MKEQFINDGIENFDFHIDSKTECQKLSQIILSGDYTPQRPQRILVEKSKGLCRQLVIPSVRDCIVLQCLSDAFYKEIKDKSPTKKSFFEPKDHKFSSEPVEYGMFTAWVNFQKNLFKFSKTRNFIVVTDISNYYDSISYTHLRNALSPITGVDECVLDMLIYVLNNLLWQPDYTPKIEIGLPQINLDAPRLLAHCFLYELDSFLDKSFGGDFVRYMDDIDVGVDTIADARKALMEIDLVLQTKQIRLNSGKTKILNKSDAVKHFRIYENFRIDTVKTSIENRIKSNKSIDRQKILISRRIHKGIRTGEFDDGNGEKVLKRWITLAAQTGVKIDSNVIENIVKNRPSVRVSIYNFIRKTPLTPSISKALARCLQSKLLVDDAAMVEMANHLVETQVRTRHSHPQINDIILSMNPKSYYGLYSKLWLQSKYGTTEELLKTLSENSDIWIPHENLGRLAASFLPIFLKSKEENNFKELLNSTLNSGVRETYKFHISLMRDKDKFKSMFRFLKSPNHSRGTGITHAKFICLLSALLNTNADKNQLIELKFNNGLAFKDTYYKSIAKRLKVI